MENQYSEMATNIADVMKGIELACDLVRILHENRKIYTKASIFQVESKDPKYQEIIDVLKINSFKPFMNGPLNDGTPHPDKTYLFLPNRTPPCLLYGVRFYRDSDKIVGGLDIMYYFDGCRAYNGVHQEEYPSRYWCHVEEIINEAGRVILRDDDIYDTDNLRKNMTRADICVFLNAKLPTAREVREINKIHEELEKLNAKSPLIQNT